MAINGRIHSLRCDDGPIIRLKIMNAKVTVYAGIIALWLLALFQLSSAHPHVFIENSLTMIFDSKGLAGIRVKWVFDEFFSNMLAADYDRNNNHKLESSEITTIRKKAFDNLVEFDYFTFIRINGKPFKVKYIREFSAALIGGRLMYEFLIPCHVSGSGRFKEVKISQYDPTYYSRVAFDGKRPVVFQDVADFEIHYRITINKEDAYYYDQIHPVEVILRFRRKDG